MLIEQAFHKTGQRTVVLIDEYDKPILDNITDHAIGTDMREVFEKFVFGAERFRCLFTIRFLTGVSKFSKCEFVFRVE